MYQTQQQNYGYQLGSRPTYQTGSINLGIKGRPVTSFEEARASIIDFDGSVFYFPDLANRRIYTKQINMDGTAAFNVFELSAPMENAPAPVYVTKDELDEILASFKASLVQEKHSEPAPAPKPKAPQTFNL